MKFFLSRTQRELIEEVLRKYPDKEKEYQRLDKTISDLCRPPSISQIGGSGLIISSSEPERIAEAKESNKEYKWLEHYLEIVRGGMRRLSGQERKIISLFYWEGLTNLEVAEEVNLEERYCRKIRNRALYKLGQVFIPHFLAQK